MPVDFYKYALSTTGTTALDAIAVANLAPTSATGSLTVIVPQYYKHDHLGRRRRDGFADRARRYSDQRIAGAFDR